MYFSDSELGGRDMFLTSGFFCPPKGINLKDLKGGVPFFSFQRVWIVLVNLSYEGNPKSTVGLKQITNKDLLYITENSAQYSEIT